MLISKFKRESPRILMLPTLVELNFNNPIRPSTLSSTQFKYNGFDAFLGDDGLGRVSIFRYNDTKQKVDIIVLAGTIDYTSGRILVQNFLPTSYSDQSLNITVTTENLDIIPVREQILLMDSADAKINVVGEQT